MQNNQNKTVLRLTESGILLAIGILIDTFLKFDATWAYGGSITLCSMLRIPVSMHNVPVEKIFRPAAWNAFGMDKEGADFRACKNYGPLYK